MSIGSVWMTAGLMVALAADSAAGADKPATPPGAEVGYADSPLAELVDADFADAVDLAKLRQALRTLNQAVLLEQAGQLARAEQQVGRPHKAIRAEAVFRVLLRAVADTRDREGLERVAAELDKLGKHEFRPLIEQTRKLLSAPRRLDLPPDVPVGEVSPEAILLYNAFKDQIRVARVVGDADVLRELRQQVAGMDELHPKQRSHLMRMTDESLAAVAPKPGFEQVALSRLTGFALRGPAPSTKN
jgi:hypothetical protein